MTDTSTTATSTAELIALGRDREAVAAATRETPNRGAPRGGAMDGVQQLEQIFPLLEALVSGVGPDQLEAPTPCGGFTVTGVLEHMIGGASAFAPAFRGDDGVLPPTEGSVQDRWRTAMAELGEAVQSAGAQERTIAAPFGEVPGSVFARYVAFDGLIHGWDLAVATGQAYAPPAEVVAEADGFARGLLSADLRDGDTFAAETEAPAGASALERLVAFTGRVVPTGGAAR